MYQISREPKIKPVSFTTSRLKFDEKREQANQLGPGAYNTLLDQAKLNKGITFSRSRRTNLHKTSLEAEPGPGAYNQPDIFETSVAKPSFPKELRMS